MSTNEMEAVMKWTVIEVKSIRSFYIMDGNHLVACNGYSLRSGSTNHRDIIKAEFEQIVRDHNRADEKPYPREQVEALIVMFEDFISRELAHKDGNDKYYCCVCDTMNDHEFFHADTCIIPDALAIIAALQETQE